MTDAQIKAIAEGIARVLDYWKWRAAIREQQRFAPKARRQHKRGAA
jgi:hypothetical protein